MAESNHSGPWLTTKDQYSVIQCLECGYAHLDPIPTGTKEYYENDLFYSEYSPPDWLQKELSEYNDGLWNASYEYQARLLNQHATLVDIGAGTGTFVDYWISNCNNVISYGLAAHNSCRNGFGIEPSKQARSYSPCQYAMFDIKDGEERTWELDGNINFRFSLVLEHIPDARGFLRHYVDHMIDGDQLMVIVPNDFSPLQNKVKGNWFISPVHINYFTPETLSSLLKSLKLRIVHESATFPMELFILMGMDYRGKDHVGRKAHAMRMKFEKMFGVSAFKLYERLYRSFGWGREIIMVAQK